MQRAVIYARYSPGPNQTEQSIEGQVRECTKYAEQHDLRIVGTYVDRKISGKTDNRREFQRMIDDSEKHIFDVIILYHTDRFARNRYDSAIYKHKLKENGVELRYATTDIPKGPEGIILESIMEGWAEYYSAELSRKIKRGMRESALKCHSTGAGRCLGYRTAEDKSLVIEPEGAKAVQTVFDMYIKGKSHADICRYLNDCGFRTAQGKLFNKNSVTHIIRNKRYIGVYTYDDITIEDGIPAIISKDTFHLAQLEAAGKLSCVITQNIDGLHQAAGSRRVYELHGTVHRGWCTRCGKRYGSEYLNMGEVPTCACGGVISPAVVLYEDPLDSDVCSKAIAEISAADLLIVAGTSLTVYPAAGFLRYFGGSELVLINRAETQYDRIAGAVCRCNVGELMAKIKA